MKSGSRKDMGVVEDSFWGKLEEFGGRVPFIKDAIALYRYMVDPEVRWVKKTFAVGALAYFISPIDVIPDYIPIIGLLDDAAVIAATVAYLSSELEKYYRSGRESG